MSIAPKQVFAEIQRYCLAKPGAVEEYPWQDVVWKVGKKMFAATGPDSPQVTVKATLQDQAVLVQHPAIEPAAYVGRYGWVTIQVTDDDTLALARKLIDESYAAVAPRKRARAAGSE